MQSINVACVFCCRLLTIEFGEIQKFARLAEQAGESYNKYTANCIFVQKSRHDYTLSCYIKNTKKCCIIM